MKYYYQMNKGKELFLPDKWVNCGGVRDYGTQEEIEKSIEFYLNHFSKHDCRGVNMHKPDGNFKVVIVEGSHGNVAGRDGAEITESDMLVKYNF